MMHNKHNHLRTGNIITPFNLFKYGLIVLVILTIVQLPFLQGRVFFSLLHSDISDTFMDFFNSIFDAVKENPYEERGIIYPPLTQIYYRLCSVFLQEGGTAKEWRVSQQGFVLVLAATALSFILLYKSLLPKGKETEHDVKNVILWILFGTVPFWYAIERANIIILTLAFLAFFVQYYRSENWILRELALISLAIAVAFKIYPVFFGILLLMNKQYKEAVRCIIYGAVIFFLPFALFGGTGSIGIMIENIIKTSAMMTHRGWGFKLNIDNTLGFLAEMLHVDAVDGMPIKLVFVAVIAVSLLLSQKEWQQIMALSSIMIIFPGFSYTYTMIFVAIPLIMFLTSEKEATTRNLIFAVLFLGMFAPFPLEGKKLFDAAPDQVYALNLTTVVSSLSLLVMMVMIAWDTIECRLRKTILDPDRKVAFLGLEWNVAVVRFAVIMIITLAAAVAAYIHIDQLYTVVV